MAKKYEMVSEVPEEIISLWETALEQGEVPIDLSSKAEAWSLRQRLYRARKLLLKEKYPNSAQMMKLEIAAEEPTEGGAWRIILRYPSWLKETRVALEKAGVDTTTKLKEGNIPTAEVVRAKQEESSPEDTSHARSIHEFYGIQEEGNGQEK